ncbi:type IV toxin-antitoxin system AbiEi family antitoxin [Flavobacterium sp. J27]|uniref:type IV toxin-antitoxin system AbiEi family antitoxin n=1 Tax=Flavobacterium sp. J27 TaxID=2060419 RepID=UPI00102F4752|nr:type IV toxin-antitoxin system AbiEi family antitoxin [Flavobacterium sp. J27]
MAINVERRKELYDLMPEGLITTRKWLMENNLSRHAIDNLVKSDQLQLISKGIYVRNSSKITWQSLVYSLQTILKTDFVLGGLSALEIQGLSHYLSFSENKTIHLYGNDKIPNWLIEIDINIKFIKHTTKGFLENENNESQNKLFTIEREWDNEGRKLIIATPERAYLEVLSDVPSKITFEHADQLIQGLTTLSPRSLQKLLEKCQNIKVKRLFLWFAERHNYAWSNKLDHDKITLGSGNRMIVKGGKLDKKYKITVPEWL